MNQQINININNNKKDGQAQSGGLMSCWLDLMEKLVFMSAGIFCSQTKPGWRA